MKAIAIAALVFTMSFAIASNVMADEVENAKMECVIQYTATTLEIMEIPNYIINPITRVTERNPEAENRTELFAEANRTVDACFARADDKLQKLLTPQSS